MLFEVLEVVRREQKIGVDYLSRYFQSTPSAIIPILDRLEKKGMIKRLQPLGRCAKRCTSCDEGDAGMYQPSRDPI